MVLSRRQFAERFIALIALFPWGYPPRDPHSRRPAPTRCAIYTRQSVSSDDDLSSCEVQHDLCRASNRSIPSDGSFAYDYRDESIQAKLIVPKAPVPEAVSEEAVASVK